MSLLRRLTRPASRRRAAIRLPVPPGADGEPVPLSGTTTFGARALESLFAAHGNRNGPLELPGKLVPEPWNSADPHAVAVHVEGERIGYLQGGLAKHLDLAHGDVRTCMVQLWAAQEQDRLRVIGWVAAAPGPVDWPHSSTNPPAVTITDQRAARAVATRRMVDDALTGDDPHRAAQFRAGMVGRYHYLETVELIKQLKREGRLEEALALCYAAIEAAEADRGDREPAPWYTEQAAIIHRKRGDHAEEVAVLERWLRACPPDLRSGSRLQQRLDKLRDSS